MDLVPANVNRACPHVRRQRNAALAIRSQPLGPGDLLHQDLARRGWHEEAGCNCPAIRGRMNVWGPVGCREPENLAWIVGEMLKEGRRRKIKRASLPGARLYVRRLVLLAVRRAEQARRLPIRRLPRSTARGIVTGGSAMHWPCLGALAIGAGSNGLGFAVADHGLADWQHEELDRIGVLWIEHDRPGIDHANAPARIVSDAKAWWKPWVCAASPFDASLWVDADAVIVGDVLPLFERLEAGGWRLEEEKSPSSHPSSLQPPAFVSTQLAFMRDGHTLYSDLVRHYFGAAGVKHLARFGDLNTGVLGFRRGDSVIAEWQGWCERILADDSALAFCRVRDQSAYVLMLIDRALQPPASSLQPPALLHEDRYNWPADGLDVRTMRRRRPVPLHPPDLLAAAIARNPQAAIVHWLGRVKPWPLPAAPGRGRNQKPPAASQASQKSARATSEPRQ